MLVADGSDPVTGDSIQVTVKPDFSGGSQVSVDNQYDAGTIRLTKTLSGDASQWAQGPTNSARTAPSGRHSDAGHDDVDTDVADRGYHPLPVGAACAVCTRPAPATPEADAQLIANVIVPAQAAPPVAVDADKPPTRRVTCRLPRPSTVPRRAR